MSAFDNLDETTKKRYVALAIARENDRLSTRIENNENIPQNERENVFDDVLIAAQEQQQAQGANQQSPVVLTSKIFTALTMCGLAFAMLVSCIWGDTCDRNTKWHEYLILIGWLCISVLIWYFGFYIIARNHNIYNARDAPAPRRFRDLPRTEKCSMMMQEFWGWCCGTPCLIWGKSVKDSRYKSNWKCCPQDDVADAHYLALCCCCHRAVDGLECHLVLLNMRKVSTSAIISFFYFTTIDELQYFQGWGSTIIIICLFLIEFYLTLKEYCLRNGRVFTTLTKGDTLHRNSKLYKSRYRNMGIIVDDASENEGLRDAGLTQTGQNTQSGQSGSNRDNGKIVSLVENAEQQYKQTIIRARNFPGEKENPIELWLDPQFKDLATQTRDFVERLERADQKAYSDMMKERRWNQFELAFMGSTGVTNQSWDAFDANPASAGNYYTDE